MDRQYHWQISLIEAKKNGEITRDEESVRWTRTT